MIKGSKNVLWPLVYLPHQVLVVEWAIKPDNYVCKAMGSLEALEIK